MRLRLARAALAATFVALMTNAATAQQGDKVCQAPWQTLGSGVSIHFTRVTGKTNDDPKATWTWCFKNEGTRTIESIEYAYIDSEGEHNDIMPERLPPGRGSGGWAAYSSTGRPTRLWIKSIKYKPDTQGGNDMRSTSSRRTRLVTALLLVAAGPVHAQKVRVDQANGRLNVSNALPARIAVLLVSYGPRGAEEYVTGVVDANGSTELRARGRSPYVLARIEPLHARVGTTATAGMDCDTRAIARTLPLRADSLRATLDRLRFEGTPEAEQEIAVASQLAQVELQQHLDALQLRSFMYHSLRETDTASDWSDVQRRNKEDSEQQRDQLIGQMAYTAIAHDEELQAKLRVLDRQADAMQKVAEQADSAIQLVDGMARGARVEAEGGRALDELVRREIAPLLGRNSGTLDGVSELARACAEAGTVSDWIGVHAMADRARSIAFARVEFDNGERHDAPLRRVAGSDDWALHLYWPSDAQRVTVRFVDEAGHSIDRRLDLGHQPLRQSVDAAHKRLDDIKKKYKSTRYRSEGGDQLKTIIVP